MFHDYLAWYCMSRCDRISIEHLNGWHSENFDRFSGNSQEPRQFPNAPGFVDTCPCSPTHAFHMEIRLTKKSFSPNVMCVDRNYDLFTQPCPHSGLVDTFLYKVFFSVFALLARYFRGKITPSADLYASLPGLCACVCM